MAGSFYETDGDRFLASPLTRGPWDERFQHGGPPAALLAGAMEAYGSADAFFVARVTVELHRPVPIDALQLSLREGRMGRTVQRLHAALHVDGKCVMEAQALRIKRAEIPVQPDGAVVDWPDPEDATPHEFTFFQHDIGYHKAIEVRLAYGAWGRTPVGFWARPRLPLVAGRATTPLERVLILADAQSGMGPPLDPAAYTFANPDLTVYLERTPVEPWLGFDIRSTAGPHGIGLSESAIRDVDGSVGRSAQSLVVRPRDS
jgi:hypothetical protein